MNYAYQDPEVKRAAVRISNLRQCDGPSPVHEFDVNEMIVRRRVGNCWQIVKVIGRNYWVADIVVEAA